jgi:hypothetical protein
MGFHGSQLHVLTMVFNDSMGNSLKISSVILCFVGIVA